MPEKSQYDLNFRPTSYWDDSMATKIANIKGEFRRREVIEAARSSKLGDLPNEISLEKLPDVLRDAVGKMHPAFMGGEYLPDSKPTEVEIARISLESTTWDVISIRARKTATCIKYRIVDEEGSNFEFGPKQSKRPLTFGQLISLIDGASLEGQPGGLTTVFRDDNLSSGLHDPEELLDFVSVTSVFYPDLERRYEEEAREWCDAAKQAE